MERFLQNIFSKLDMSSVNIPHIGLNSFIDVIVVTFVTYTLIMWIKETRAWSLFKGVLVLGVIAIGSYLFELYVVFWIISSMFSIGIIAVIIIFQPELRRALEQLGKSRLAIVGEGRPQVTEHAADEIVEAVFEMSRAKTGALIVIEREVALGDFEQTGVPLDAIVTSKLLVNIFVNKTPLHDGAVVICGSRLAAAACILPLTAVELGENMGTRHRAAIGASEVSDALVVVVSEETGIVSVAESGRITRRLGDQALHKLIFGGVKTVQSPKNILRKGFWKGLFSGGGGDK